MNKIDELLEHLDAGRSGEAGTEAAATIRALREALVDTRRYAIDLGIRACELNTALDGLEQFRTPRQHLLDACKEMTAALEVSHGRVG